MVVSNFYKNLPKKIIASGALFFNQEGEILIVKPSYKNHWLIPGGVAEENESPRGACQREIKEEIGLTIKSLKLLCVDYLSYDKKRSESLQFIFYGGVLNQNQISQIKPFSKEISEYKFVKTKKGISMVSNRLAKRMTASFWAIKDKNTVYLENGKKKR